MKVVVEWWISGGRVMVTAELSRKGGWGGGGDKAEQWRERNIVNKRRKKIVSRWGFACAILVFSKQQRSNRRCIFTEDMSKKDRITVVGIMTKP